jgi:hypothetical protein
MARQDNTVEFCGALLIYNRERGQQQSIFLLPNKKARFWRALDFAAKPRIA